MGNACRMRLRAALAGGALVWAMAGGGCGARTGLLVPPPDASDASLLVSGKVDLLFMIDNSGSMGDKQELLRQAIPDLINRLITPKCIDDSGNILADSQNGACSAGHLEFKPVPDIHVAIVTSSLGGAGSDVCPDDQPNPVDPTLLAHDNDQGHLVNRTANGDQPVAEAQPSNFLAWFPDVEANKGNPTPPVTAITDPAKLVARFQDLVDGVGQYGCGFEAQLESWYRFLVQPDPYESVQVSNGTAQLVGLDQTILKQRHDFLRPDSLLAVIVVTDENDSNVDPQALGGQAWAYLNSTFPGSPTSGPPRPTSACATAPLSPACTACPPGSPDPACAPNGGFYTPTENPLNVRMFHMRQRFGVDPMYPLQRYVDGLSSAKVPDRNGEHPNGSPDYVGTKDCVNPVFAQNLPDHDTGNLCNLERGPRSPDLVYFALIGGVPHQLLQVDPTNPDSPQKNKLTDADWQKILGADPLSYDFTGVDPHMLESIDPRPGLPPPTSPDNADPINGREWDTGGNFLQYACIFQLQTPHDCTDPKYTSFCDCSNPTTSLPPLCDPTTPTLQIRAKAYPTIRELALARQLGTRATVSSLCPIHITESQQNDPLYGYRPAIGGIVEAFRAGLVH
jgi:hypothetical protein